jgi:hypothetical protein
MATYVDWLKQDRPNLEISPLGEKVANILGLLYRGLYNCDAHHRIKWGETRCIEINVDDNYFSTYDFDYLTRLVFLAHEFCVRVSVCQSGRGMIKIQFHERKNRTGGMWERHPTLDHAVSSFHAAYDNEIAYLTGQEVTK